MDNPDDGADDDFADYYRKGVPLYSPEVLALLLLVASGILLVVLVVWWIG